MTHYRQNPQPATSLLPSGASAALPISSIASGAILSSDGTNIVGIGPSTTTGNTLAESSGTFVSSCREYAIGSTSVVGLAAINESETAGATPEWGPILVSGGTARKTNATAESQEVLMGWQTRPTNGAAAAAGAMYLTRSINGSAWSVSNLPYFKSDGLHYVPNLICTTGVMGTVVQTNGDPSGTAGRCKLSNATPEVPGSVADSTPNIPDVASGTYVWVKILTGDGNATYLKGVQ